MYWDTTAPRDSFYYVNQWGPAYEADKAIEYIQTQKENKQPFALVVSMNPPHTGYELVPDKYKALYKDIDVEASVPTAPTYPPKEPKWETISEITYAIITPVSQG